MHCKSAVSVFTDFGSCWRSTYAGKQRAVDCSMGCWQTFPHSGAGADSGGMSLSLVAETMFFFFDENCINSFVASNKELKRASEGKTM